MNGSCNEIEKDERHFELSRILSFLIIFIHDSYGIITAHVKS